MPKATPEEILPSFVLITLWDSKLELVSLATPLPSIPRLFKFSLRVSHSLRPPLSIQGRTYPFRGTYGIKLEVQIKMAAAA